MAQTEDWNAYEFVDGETPLIEKGNHVLRIQFTGSYVNMDWIQFALTETLKQAGFARGIYIVRGSSLANTLRVQLK